MKKLIAVAAGVVLINLSVLAQGTISFQNVGAGLNQPVRAVGGALIAAGATQYVVELLAGATAGSVAPFATPITTTTWVGSGLFGVGNPAQVLAGFAGGSFPFFEVRVYDNTTGANYAAATVKGTSGIFQLVPGGGLNGLGNPAAVPPVPAPALFGMTGFTLVPEPSTIALGVLGAAALLLRRRK